MQDDLPETRLNLTLVGTFTHSDPKKASALIAEANKPSQRFYIGEHVSQGAELKVVNAGNVILRRNGQDEQLKLPILKPTDPAAVVVRKQPTNDTPQPTTPRKRNRLTDRIKDLRALQEKEAQH